MSEGSYELQITIHSRGREWKNGEAHVREKRGGI